MKYFLTAIALLLSNQALAQTVVSSTDAHVTGSNPTITITGVSVGDTILVQSAVGANLHATGCLDSVTGETVNLDYAPSPIEQNSVYRGAAFCSVVNVKTGGSHTITVDTSGAGNFALFAEDVSGLGASAAFDQAATLNSSAGTASTSAVTSSITPAHAKSILVALITENATSVTYSAWTNSFTALNALTNSPNAGNAYLVQATPAAVTAGATLSTADYWIAGIAVYYGTVASTPTGFVISNGHALMSNGKPVVVN